jgi:quinol monooxygenase YgiN
MAHGYIGSMKTKSGHRDDVVSILSNSFDQLRELGCVFYLVGLSDTDDDTIWVTEIWQSKAHHDEAIQLPEAHEAMAKAMPMLIGEFNSEELTLAGGLGW